MRRAGRWFELGFGGVFWCALLGGLFAQGDAAEMGAARQLVIHFEDDHSGSFFHLAETLPLDEPHALVLFDSHSDASATARSDDLRRQLREVRSIAERGQRLEEWRRQSRVQVFDWIEPLMPRPLDSVWWVAPGFDDESARRLGDKEADEFIDARLDFEKRDGGSLAERFHVLPPASFEHGLPSDLPLIASLDLDYFMNVDTAAIPGRFEKLWSRILSLPNLRVVTLSLSRPWLRDEEQAQQLTELALRASLELRNATVRFEPYAPRGPDRSELSKRLAADGRTPKRLDLSRASSRLRALMIHGENRIEVRYDVDRWQRQLKAWRAELGDWRIVVEDHVTSVDGIWRIAASAAPAVRVRDSSGMAAQRVRWVRLKSEREAYDVLPDWALGTKFVGVAAPLIRLVEITLGESSDGALDASSWKSHLDTITGWGSLDLVAEIDVDGEWQRTPPITLRVFDDSRGPFAAALSEQFQLPYVFGAGFLRAGEDRGPDTGVGNDCANFLVYAWRRSGQRLPWCNPAQLRRHLETVAEDCSLGQGDAIRLAASDIERGLMIDCDSHVAALWEDRQPLGVLDGSDWVVHHLGAVPERLTLTELLAERPRQKFAVRRLPGDGGEADSRLLVGGDICLAGEAKFSPSWEEKGTRLANLETALTDRRLAAREKRFLFRAPPQAAQWLSHANLAAVSLANNHSEDFGEEGLRDTTGALDDAGVGHFGTMARSRDDGPWQLRPWRLPTEGKGVAVFGVNLIEVAGGDDAAEGTPSRLRVVELPRDKALLAAAIDEAAKQGNTVIVMPHWGSEYVAETTESQRWWARWLIDQGADAIVGAHSHHVQALDFYRGRPVFFSLGNLHFPGDYGPQGFRDPYWAVLGLVGDGRLRSPRLLPADSTTKDRESSIPVR